MDTAQWPQEIVVKPMDEIVVPSTTCSKQQQPSSSLERKIRPQKEQALNCPRCNSTNTKFCYYNNYSLSQPRYFCKTCRRYWTEGGSLRNIPVGGGSRKNKRSSTSSSSSATSNSSSNTSSSLVVSSSSSSKKLPDLILPPASYQHQHQHHPHHNHHQNPNKIHDGQDLNLGFSATAHDFKTITELIQVPNFDASNKDATPTSATTTSCHLSALELLTGIAPRGCSFLPMPISTDPGSVFSSSGFSLPEFKTSVPLSFSLDGLGIGGANGGGGGYGSLPSVQESSGRLLFPFEDLKQVSTTAAADHGEQNRDQNGGDSTGYWSGILGGGEEGGGGGGGSW